MAIILNIETATKNCSVCISDKENVLALTELNEGQFSHAEKLHTFILDVIKKSNKTIQDIDAVAVSKGPGSYTGLRIGVSAAKGLCFSLDKPLISVSTLESLAHSIQVEKDALIIPMIDARRMEVYSAVFNHNYRQIREIRAEILNSDSFSTFLGRKNVYFVGDGAEKCKGLFENEEIEYRADGFPSSREMAKLAYKKYLSKEFEDLAYFEPFYLKDFIAGKPKKIF